MRIRFVTFIGAAAAMLCLIVWPMAIAGVVEAAAELPPSLSGLVKQAAPGVVNIMATKVIQTQAKEAPAFDGNDPLGDFFDRYFGDRMPREYRQGAVGSGFIIDAKGLILTNNHVVEDATNLKVKLASNVELKAEIVGRDPQTDLALIRIKADQSLTALPLGDSDALDVGDWIVAIGNPFGLGNTVTAGIVSAKYRRIGAGTYNNFIQTDASINPGNSGGPLLNMQGQVIGINSAILSQSGSGVGIGFAIPINMVKELLPQLRQGKVRRSYLGVMIQDITPALKAKLNLRTDNGALVSDVAPGGPAATAGMQRGDVIVGLDGKAVKASQELPFMVAATPIGRKITVVVLRQDRTLTLQAVTEELEEEESSSQYPSEDPQLGLTLQTLTPELARNYGMVRTRGVLVTRVEEGSPAADADLQEGDIILEVDQQPVAEVDAFKRSISRPDGEDTLLLLVDRGGATLFVILAVA